MLVDLSRVPERKHRRRCHASSSATEGFSGILEVYKVPKGIGALNTDKMCGVRVGNPHNSPPPGGQWGGCEAEEGGEAGVGWGECGVAIGVITHTSRQHMLPISAQTPSPHWSTLIFKL